MPDDDLGGGWVRLKTPESPPSGEALGGGWTRLKDAVAQVGKDRPAAPESTSLWEALKQSALRGGRDALEGGAQIGARMGAEEGGAAFADPQELARRRETVDTTVRASEKAYGDLPAVRSHPIASMLGRFGGNVAATAPLAAIPGFGLAPSATRSAAGLIGRGALSSAAGAATAPVLNTEDYWGEKLKQAGIWAAIGGAIPGVGSALSPRLPDPGLMKSMSGGFARAFRPLYNFFTGAEERTVNGFDRTIARQVLDPIGGRIDGRPSGPELMRQTNSQISKEYDRILPNVQISRDRATRPDPELDDFIATMSEDHRNRFTQLIERKFTSKFGDQGVMDGKTFQKARSDLLGYARSWLGTNDNDLGQAVLRKVEHLQRGIADENPEWAPDLKRANESYRLWVRMRTAASDPRKEEKFTPDDMLKAVGQVDRGHTWSGDRPLQAYSVAARHAMGQERAGLMDLIRVFHRVGAPISLAEGAAGGAGRLAKAVTPGLTPAAGMTAGREQRAGPSAADLRRDTLTMANPPSPEQRAKQRLKAAAKVGEIQKERFDANRRGDIARMQKLSGDLADAQAEYRRLGGGQ